MNKTYKLIKTVLFILIGILVLLFSESLIINEGTHINIYVGLVIAFFGIEMLLSLLIKNEFKSEQVKLLSAILNIVIGVTMVFLIEGREEEVRLACTIWSIWSILRESEEISEKVIEEFKEHPATSIINLIESLVVIYFSIKLIIVEPASLIEDALAHFYLLGVELILEVLWPHIAQIEIKIKESKITK